MSCYALPHICLLVMFSVEAVHEFQSSPIHSQTQSNPFQSGACPSSRPFPLIVLRLLLLLLLEVFSSLSLALTPQLLVSLPDSVSTLFVCALELFFRPRLALGQRLPFSPPSPFPSFTFPPCKCPPPRLQGPRLLLFFR